MFSDVRGKANREGARAMSTKLYLHFPETNAAPYEISPMQEIIAGKSISEKENFLNLPDYIEDEDLLRSVSRKHLRIFFKEGQFFIEDTSTNGTLIFSHRLPKGDPVPLFSGDEITLQGADRRSSVMRVELVVELPPETTDLVLPPLDPALQPIQARLNKLENLLLLGSAGAGKTTLLNKLRLETQDADDQSLPEHRFFLFCYIDCLGFLEIDDLSPAVFFGTLLDRIAELIDGIEALPDASVSIDEVKEAIKTVHQDNRRKVVFLLDHFDNVFAEFPSKVFLGLVELKSLFQENLIYVIAMQNELDRGNEPTRKFLRTFASKYWLPPFEDDQLKKIIVSDRLIAKELDRIRELSGGRPRLAQLVATRMGEMAEIPESTDDLIHQLLSDDDIDQHCHEIWHSLQPNERDVLRSVAKGRPKMADRLRTRLVKEKSLLMGEGTGLSFQSRLFGAFVRSGVETEPGLHIDETIPGAVLNGDPVRLTRLELGLLSYLIFNAGIPCTYDMIAESVWPERAASDEMISQRVMSLRRKLDNVSLGAGKRYIETVREVGGYKYVPD
jgi:Cdc6-like AAA superfamily ATPase